MNFKNELLSYFEKTEIPPALEPEKVVTFVKPRIVEKKAVETAAEKPEPKKAAPAEPKKEAAPNGNIQAKSEQKQENPPQAETGASAFIKLVFYHKLTRSEFLTLLGNTKIDGQSYVEIRDNPQLTVRGLIDILDKSPLTSEDYKKLIIAAERMAQLKAEAKEKLRSEEPKRSPEAASNTASNAASKPTLTAASNAAPKTGSPIVPPASSKPKINLNELTSPKTQEMPPIEEHEPDRSRTAEFRVQGEEETASHNEATAAHKETDGEGLEEKKGKPKRKLLFGRTATDEDYDDIEDFGDSDDEDEDDEEDRGRKSRRRKKKIAPDDEDEDYDEDHDDEFDNEHRSNKGKFVAAVIGAVALIGLSFGIRYYFTGSILPNTTAPVEEINVNEESIFDLLSNKQASQLSEYDPTPTYTVGGIQKETPLKQIISTEKRLVYISGNSLYIFEQIGGQTDQLDVRNYLSDIKLMGLVETEKGIAVISCNDGEPYTFFRTEENSGNGEETGEGSQPQTVSDFVIRPETVVELLDKDNPEKRASIVKYRLSGTLSDIFAERERLILLTEENIPANSTKEDYVTFMPFVLTSEGRRLCSSDNAVVSQSADSRTVTAVFALDFDNDTAMACTAGNSVKAAALNNGFLYLGAGDQLVQLSLSENLSEKNRYTVKGSFEDFSEIGISLDSATAEQRIRFTSKNDNAAALTILDGEFKLLHEVKNLGNGEAAAATCFYKDQTYIVTESGACFGIDGNNDIVTESTVKITGSHVYPLSTNENNPIGIKISPTDDGGKRTGLTVITVRLDGTETNLGAASISSKTVAKNALDEYLSSPVEEDIFVMGSKESADSSGGGTAVVPVVYFDGVSEVELFVIYTVAADGTLSVNGTVAQYDSYSKSIFALVKNDYIIAVTDKRITTAKVENGNVTSYYDITGDDSEYNY